ncbi:hypothetical protein [Enterobacter sp. Bisph1]|uniref:hypothetical protein n=1 Tax=Enterobacter sp. Bisph1 TaxID=1274399 RepID=UPI00057BFA0D|nr:hypothetical protein [Enterobacter sp. Bisph1]
MKGHPSISSNTVVGQGKGLIKRALDDKEICAPTVGYDRFLFENASEGICFGAALFWATQSLKKVRTHKLPYCVKTKKPTELTPTKFKLEFYEFCANLQYSFDNGFVKQLGAQKLVKLLNQQEERLQRNCKKRLKKPASRLHYTGVNPQRVAEIAEGMFNNKLIYSNSALILSTALKLPVTSEKMEHASVLLHFNKRLFFFDVNKGIYYIVHPERLHWTSLLLTLAENFDIAEPYQEDYLIAPLYNIFIKVN